MADPLSDSPAPLLQQLPVFDQFPWLTPLLLVVGGVVVGWLCERLAMARLRAFAARTTWKGDDLLIEGLKGVVFVWCVLVGLYAAVQVGHLEGRIHELAVAALKVGWILSLTLALARIAGAALRLASSHIGDFASSTIAANLVRIAIVILGGLVALDALGISITPILTALGVGGLAVALALQEPLSNFFAGLQIVATKKVRLGDYVRLDSGDEGRVTDITWRNTSISTLAGNTVIVPNAKLASVVVTNFQMPDPGMWFAVPVGVGYGSDLEQVERVALEVAREVLATVPGGVADAQPSVRFTAFADSAITFNIGLRVQEFPDQFLVRHELIKRLHARFRAEGIEIPFPMRTVIMRPGPQA